MTSPAEWLRTSVEHPGFTALLSPLRWAARDDPTVLVYPVLVAGGFARRCLRLPAVAGLRGGASAARSWRSSWSLPGVIADSDHLKTYVIDLSIVAIVAAVLPRVVARRWTSRFAVAWVLGALVVTTFSAFALVATAVAGVVLVVQANRDRRTRVVAIAAQLFLQLVYFFVISQTYSSSRPRPVLEAEGGYIDLRANPVAVAADAFAHLRGVVKALPGRLGWRRMAPGLPRGRRGRRTRFRGGAAAGTRRASCCCCSRSRRRHRRCTCSRSARAAMHTSGA